MFNSLASSNYEYKRDQTGANTNFEVSTYVCLIPSVVIASVKKRNWWNTSLGAWFSDCQGQCLFCHFWLPLVVCSVVLTSIVHSKNMHFKEDSRDNFRCISKLSFCNTKEFTLATRRLFVSQKRYKKIKYWWRCCLVVPVPNALWCLI